MDIADELRLLISLLDEHGIDYALCGGLAMSVYGKPRSTIDIDLLTLPESLDEDLVDCEKHWIQHPRQRFEFQERGRGDTTRVQG